MKTDGMPESKNVIDRRGVPEPTRFDEKLKRGQEENAAVPPVTGPSGAEGSDLAKALGQDDVAALMYCVKGDECTCTDDARRRNCGSWRSRA